MIGPPANSTPRRSPAPSTGKSPKRSAFAVRNMRVGAYKDPARVDLPAVQRRGPVRGSRQCRGPSRLFDARQPDSPVDVRRPGWKSQSPGSLPNSLTVDELEYRQATRNEVLASVFGRIPTSGIQGAGGRLFIMERRGDGIPVIRRENPRTRRATAAVLTWLAVRTFASPYRGLHRAESGPSTEPSPARVLVTVCAGDLPLADAGVLVLFPNKTWKQATTDALGQANIGLHTVDLPMTVFAAAHGFAAYCEREWMPAEGVLTIELNPLPDGGAVIFFRSDWRHSRAAREAES